MYLMYRIVIYCICANCQVFELEVTETVCVRNVRIQFWEVQGPSFNFKFHVVIVTFDDVY